jgi:hypothetical protein
MDSGTISAVIAILGSLSLLSLFFNSRIERAGNSIEGMSWLLVVIGVSYTLAGLGLLDVFLNWNAGFEGVLAFSASGWPMVLGAYKRHSDMISRTMKAAKEEQQ